MSPALRRIPSARGARIRNATRRSGSTSGDVTAGPPPRPPLPPRPAGSRLGRGFLRKGGEKHRDKNRGGQNTKDCFRVAMTHTDFLSRCEVFHAEERCDRAGGLLSPCAKPRDVCRNLLLHDSA